MGAQTSGCEVWSSREMDTTLDAIRLTRGGREWGCGTDRSTYPMVLSLGLLQFGGREFFFASVFVGAILCVLGYVPMSLASISTRSVTPTRL